MHYIVCVKNFHISLTPHGVKVNAVTLCILLHVIFPLVLVRLLNKLHCNVNVLGSHKSADLPQDVYFVMAVSKVRVYESSKDNTVLVTLQQARRPRERERERETRGIAALFL